MPAEPEIKIRCLALVRGQDIKLVKTAGCDLERWAHLITVGAPRMCDPVYADEVLVHVMNRPLARRCMAAAVVALEDEPLNAICRLKKTHPPAHVIIVSPDHGIYGEVLESMNMMPAMDLTMPKKHEVEQ